MLRTLNILIKGDSKMVITWISEAPISLDGHPMLGDLRKLISTSFKVAHVYREANSAAD